MDSGQDVCFSSEYTAAMEPRRWSSSQSFLLHPDVKEAWPPAAVLANPIYFFLPFPLFFNLFQSSSLPTLLPFPCFHCSSRTFRSRKELILL
jgi:hypothetical protein